MQTVDFQQKKDILMNDLVQKRQTLHRQLQSSQEQNTVLSRQADRLGGLAAVGMGWTMAAHEINNLLTPVANYARLALANPQDTELTQKALNKSILLTERATEILQRVMLLAGQKDIEKQDVTVKSLVEDVFACIGRDFHKDRIDVDIAIPEDIIIHADGPSVRQVLMNLILNARQAMIHGGELRIRSYQTREAVWVEITDTGEGISPETMKKVFDPFYSTKNEGRNNGIGLAFCRQIIEKHNGLMTVESEVSKGSCFRICLPKSDKS
jgi:signal transduction histidine kinase